MYNPEGIVPLLNICTVCQYLNTHKQEGDLHIQTIWSQSTLHLTASARVHLYQYM